MDNHVLLVVFDAGVLSWEVDCFYEDFICLYGWMNFMISKLMESPSCLLGYLGTTLARNSLCYFCRRLLRLLSCVVCTNLFNVSLLACPNVINFLATEICFILGESVYVWVGKTIQNAKKVDRFVVVWRGLVTGLILIYFYLLWVCIWNSKGGKYILYLITLFSSKLCFFYALTIWTL